MYDLNLESLLWGMLAAMLRKSAGLPRYTPGKAFFKERIVVNTTDQSINLSIYHSFYST